MSGVAAAGRRSSRMATGVEGSSALDLGDRTGYRSSSAAGSDSPEGDWWMAYPARGAAGSERSALPGRKPRAFCAFPFDSLGMVPGDLLLDRSPGSGIVARAWEALSGTSTTTSSAALGNGARRPPARGRPSDGQFFAPDHADS